MRHERLHANKQLEIHVGATVHSYLILASEIEETVRRRGDPLARLREAEGITYRFEHFKG